MEMRNQSQSGRASYSRKKLTSKIETQWPGQETDRYLCKAHDCNRYFNATSLMDSGLGRSR